MSYTLRVTLGAPQHVLRVTSTSATNTDPPQPGGSATPAGPAQEAGELLVSGRPDVTFASWVTPTGQQTEGGTFVGRVRLSEPAPNPLVLPIRLAASSTLAAADVTFPAEIIWNVGQQELEVQIELSATAAQAGMTIGDFVLDPSIDSSTGLPTPVVDATLGPDELELTVTDAAAGGGPVSWTLVPGPIFTPEGVGVQEFQVCVSPPAAEDIVVAVLPGAGTAQAGVDYAPFSPTVTVPAGADCATYEIEFIDNAIPRPLNPELEVTGTLISGTVANPADQSWVTEIEDNDVGTGPPFLRFETASQEVDQGGTITVRASLGTESQGGVPQSFTGAATITPTRVLSDPSAASQFTPPNPQLFFEAGSSEATFEITLAASAPVGEFVEFTLPAAPNNEWRLGTRATVRITSREVASEPTELMVPSMAGGARRLIQGPVPIDPPSATLPELAVDGERLQVVGHKRNGGDLWVQAYVYGLASSDESVPGSGAATKRLSALEAEPDPVEAGAFVDPPVVTFSANVANVALPYECSTADGVPGQGYVDWTGPTGAWEQVGADLVRERVFHMRLVRSDLTPAAGQQSGDAIAILQLCEKRIAGESDVILYEGRLLNGAWDKTVDPRASSPMVDGELNVLVLSVETPSVEGWVLDFGDPHPQQVSTGVHKGDLLTARPGLLPYFFRECDSEPFHFAFRRAGAVGAEDRVQAYLRERHIAWPVGGTYGMDRAETYGEAQEPTMPWGRAQFNVEGNIGWEAVKFLGEEQGLGRAGSSSVPGVIASWTSGTRGVFSGSSNQNNGDRIGRLYTTGLSGQGQASGSGIYGQQALLPWWGFWLRGKYYLQGSMVRTNLGYRDANTFEAPFWWVLAEPDGAGDSTVPFIGTLNTGRVAQKRHFQFNTPRNTTSNGTNGDDFYGDTPVGRLQLGPVEGDRPWILSDDPGSTDVRDDAEGLFRTQWPEEGYTHIARVREGLVDGWEARRSFVAYLFWEDLAAAFSRTLAPKEPTEPVGNGFESTNVSVATQIRRVGEVPGAARLGVWPDGEPSSNRTMTGPGSVRGHAWPMLMLAGFFSVASSPTRRNLRGFDDAAAVGGGSPLQSVWDLFVLVAQDNGVPFRSSLSSARPDPGRGTDTDPTNPESFPPTDFATRSGAWPRADVDLDGAEVTATGQIMFQLVFWVRALAAIRRTFFTSFSPNQGALDRGLGIHSTIIASQRSIGLPGGDLSMPFCFAGNIGTTPAGRPSEAASISRTTLAETTQGGAVAWRWPNPDGGPDSGWRNHWNKSGITAFHEAREFNDDTRLEILRDVSGNLGTTDAQLFETLFRGGVGSIEQQLATTSGTSRYRLWNEWTFQIPALARILNSIT